MRHILSLKIIIEYFTATRDYLCFVGLAIKLKAIADFMSSFGHFKINKSFLNRYYRAIKFKLMVVMVKVGNYYYSMLVWVVSFSNKALYFSREIVIRMYSINLTFNYSSSITKSIWD